ncbi:unnamed protein product [Ambrosiozyma monospora]|uniref:Unnamed protein product n=1 Tax=Ambrosiozyma monospora TaxID=43982 RepID=A0A9W6YV14_AMBMO|nr:unnamed protein product [Ambrosiozyma monospora]
MLVLKKMSSFVFTLMCLSLTLINQVQSAPVAEFTNIITESLITDSLSTTSYPTYHSQNPTLVTSSSSSSSSSSTSESSSSSSSSTSDELTSSSSSTSDVSSSSTDSSSFSSSELSSSTDLSSTVLSSSSELHSSSKGDLSSGTSSLLTSGAPLSSHLITSSSSPITSSTSLFSSSVINKPSASIRSSSKGVITDGSYPSVYAYQNGYEGFFEIDVPATLAPFIVDISAENFYFDYNTQYAQNANVQIATEDGISSSLYTTGSYTYQDSGSGNDVRVGLGVFQGQLEDGNAMQAQFLVYPHTDVESGSYDVPATLFYTATPVTASVTGEIPVYVRVTEFTDSIDTNSPSSSDDSDNTTVLDYSTVDCGCYSNTSSSSVPSSSNVAPGQSSSLVYSTGNPVITVGVWYSGVLDVVHLSAANTDLNYIEGGETFLADEEIWPDTAINVANGKFDATAVLSKHVDFLELLATADNRGQASYPVTVDAAITYEAVATAFYPKETGISDKKLIKRGGGGSHNNNIFIILIIIIFITNNNSTKDNNIIIFIFIFYY